MTALAVRLAERIRREGPISVADFMAVALTDPQHGYYTSRDPIGAAGDFTTAPEISQMFGELIGAWLVQCWHQIGQPAPFALVELGPGHGTLMADVARVAKRDPAFTTAAHIHLVEASPTLKAKQHSALAGLPVTWHAEVNKLPDMPMLLVANEFLDALPVRQFEKTRLGWCERRIDVIAGVPGADAPAFRFVLSSPVEPGNLPATADAPIGTIAETCPQALSLTEFVTARIAARNGAALLIDYGYEGGSGDTLQAVRQHRFVECLAEPGSADLTAHVDFAAVRKIAMMAGGQVHGPVEQGRFLRALGIEARARNLRAAATSGQAQDIETALHRLIADEEMGTLFRVRKSVV